MASIPRTGVKILENNIHHKTGMVQPHSKPLKPSGQVINPFPEMIKKKVKKGEKAGKFQFGNAGFTSK